MWRLLILLSVVPLTSCATVATDRFENIVVTSSPTGADVTLVCNGKPAGRGVTPATIRIRRDAGDCDVRVAKDGFSDRSTHLEQGVNPMYWANMAFTPLLPAAFYSFTGNHQEKIAGAAFLGAAILAFGTDFWTGAVHAHKPSKIDVVLQPKP
jgi:hypothetical protein